MMDWSKIAKLLGMLGSEHDGERLNAARLLDRALKGEGATFGDLSIRVASGGSAMPPRTIIVEKPARPNPARDTAERILKLAGDRLQYAERRFLKDIVRSCDMTGGGYELTDPQARWLTLLQQQYEKPKTRKFKTVKPGPIPRDIMDDLGLGEKPGSYRGDAAPTMPDARIDEAIRRAHDKMGRKPTPVDKDMLDAIFGETPGTYKGEEHDPHGAVKRRFGALDMETGEEVND